MAVGVYKHTDGGAPTLNGVAGSLIAVLDHALVTGAGWTKVFTGTNKAVYRAPVGNRLYLRVDDTAGASALVRAYESMTDVDTGTNPFPTVAQMANAYIPKASSADTTARGWVVVATSRGFVFWANTHTSFTSFGNYAIGVYFGDIRSGVPGDAYGTVFIAGNSTVPASTILKNQVTPPYGSATGHYVARAWTAAVGSIAVGKCSGFVQGTTDVGTSGFTFPNPAGASMVLNRFALSEAGNVLRGDIPGIWAPQHNLSTLTSNLDTFSGSGAMAGRTFLLLHMYGAPSVIAVETSDTWDY